MDIYYIRSGIVIFTAALPVAIGMCRFNIMDRGSKKIFYVFVLGFVVESLAFYRAVYFRDNMAVYNLANILEVFLVALYFNATIERFNRKNIGLVIGLFSIIVGTVNIIFIQSLNVITSYFLFYQALVIIAMCIYSLSTFLKPDDTRNVKMEVHFWLPIILMFSSSLTYLLFSLISFYAVRSRAVAPQVIMALFLISNLTNIAIAIVFYLYPKLRTNA